MKAAIYHQPDHEDIDSDNEERRKIKVEFGATQKTMIRIITKETLLVVIEFTSALHFEAWSLWIVLLTQLQCIWRLFPIDCVIPMH